MARGPIERLTAKQVENAKPKPGKQARMISDGGNLYLCVSRLKGGGKDYARSWIFRFKLPGPDRKVQDIGLGSLNAVSLAEARDVAREYRGLVLKGVDPKGKRDTDKAAELAKTAKMTTFKECSERYIRQHRASWTPIYARDWGNSLETYVMPTLGKLNVADVDTPLVVKCLEPIWTSKPVLAKSLRERVEAILGWAATSGFRKGENPARWKDHLENLLANKKKREVRRQPSLPYAEMPGFISELRKVNTDSVAGLALEFIMLTFVRSSDIRNAEVGHIDRDAKVWTIPKFSKTGRQHRVPLSDRALAIVDRVNELRRMLRGAFAESDLVFPNKDGGRLGDNAMLRVLADMKLKGRMCPHGARAAFKTWSLEQTGFPWEVIELSLGHTVGDAVERAYIRGDGLKKRVAVMDAWSKFLHRPTAGDNVAYLHQAAS